MFAYATLENLRHGKYPSCISTTVEGKDPVKLIIDAYNYLTETNKKYNQDGIDLEFKIRFFPFLQKPPEESTNSEMNFN